MVYDDLTDEEAEEKERDWIYKNYEPEYEKEGDDERNQDESN